MAADPVTAPVENAQDPIDLLIAFEEAIDMPIRAEYVEGMAIVSPMADEDHNDIAAELYHQLRCQGVPLAGLNTGYRTGPLEERTRTLVVPDFFVRRRRATEMDKAYLKAAKGWYPIEMLTLAGEVTSSNHEMDTGPKYRSYAAAGVPVYVVVHRKERKVYVHSEPVSAPDASADSHYRTTAITEIGGTVLLPEPFPALDTKPLLAFL